MASAISDAKEWVLSQVDDLWPESKNFCPAREGIKQYILNPSNEEMEKVQKALFKFFNEGSGYRLGKKLKKLDKESLKWELLPSSDEMPTAVFKKVIKDQVMKIAEASRGELGVLIEPDFVENQIFEILKKEDRILLQKVPSRCLII